MIGKNLLFLEEWIGVFLFVGGFLMTIFPIAFLIFFGGIQYIGMTIIAIAIICWGLYQIGWGCDVLYYKSKANPDSDLR